MAGPRRTSAQKTGQLAEAAFAKAVNEAGLVWHPAAAGTDFGIDGKVELVEDGTVRGAEFNVQIKGTNSPRRIGRTIDLGLIKLSTLSYWTSKLLPTLLVLHDGPNDCLYVAWLHDLVLPMTVIERQREGKRSTRLRMPAERLTEQAWDAIRAEATKAHAAVRTAFDDTPVRSFYHLLYCDAADVSDVLVDTITGLAYASPWNLLAIFAPPEPDADKLAPLLEQLVAQRPPQPAAAFQNAYALIIMQVQSLDHELRAFLIGKFMFHDDNPIVRATESVQQTLHDLIHEMVDLEERPENDRVQVAVTSADMVKLLYGVGLILILLRDFQRELRPFLFPIWGKINWPTSEEVRDAIPISGKMIHTISDNLVTGFASWRVPAPEGEGRTPAPPTPREPPNRAR